MAFTNYTIIPSDGLVVLDGTAAFGVDMAGIPVDIHAIQWYGVASTGVVEYVGDPITGALPPQTQFTDPSVYSAQTTQAEAIIEAAQNPDIYYSTTNGNLVQGQTYNLGQEITISTPDTPQPANTTTSVPPTPGSFQTLYWYNDAWVISSVDPSLALADAQTFLNLAVETSAAEQGALQARIYSPAQLFATAEVGALPTADYTGFDLSAYQTYLDGRVSTLQATVAAATATSDLYSFNPAVNGNPNS